MACQYGVYCQDIGHGDCRYAPLETHFSRPDLTPEEQVDYDLAKLDRNYKITQRFIASKSA